MENIFASNATATNGSVAEDHPCNVRYIIQLIANILVFLLGVPGNCLILRVYWTKTRTTSTDILIRALAWADLAVCLLSMIQEIIGISLNLAAEYSMYSFPPGLGPLIVYAVINALADAAIVSSFSITAVIAVERYDCVCRPQKRIVNPRRSKIAVLVAVLFAIAVNARQIALDVCCRVSCAVPPSFFDWNIETIVEVFSYVIALVTVGLCYGKVYATIRKHVKVGPAQVPTARDERSPSDLRVGRQVNCSTRPTPPQQNNELLTRKSNVIDEAVTRFVNPPSTSSTTQAISYQTKANDARPAVRVVSFSKQDSSGPSQPNVIPEPKAKTAPKDDTPSQRQSRPEPGHAPQRVGAAKLQRKTTRMLFITSVVFLLTWLPFLVAVVQSYATAHIYDYKIIADLSIICLINSVVNPLIYGIANRRFRNDCKEVIREIKCFKCW
ncbi:D(2) dopamine receptor A-like [Patiria miniata]|uniref:G-protein coupled receptors family 1 profile domain-containing protein n=1 Tax=Patiria miniata TaxID=46514 RepID=A0A913ZD61_PATMI|nr:D(2) dopamine receptor A-like [Patiria miniata]